MTLLVAVGSGSANDGAVPLAVTLSRRESGPPEPLVLCSVVPTPWAPGPAKVDAEYRDFLRDRARQALSRARASVPDGIEVREVVTEAASVPTGLIDQANTSDARMLVLGSSSAGSIGRIVFGGVTSRLLHSSPVALAVAPRGHRGGEDVLLSRVSVAYSGASADDNLVLDAAEVARRRGAPLRLVSFAVRPPTSVTAGVGMSSEAQVVDGWIRDVSSSKRKLLADLPEVTSVVARAHDWFHAFDAVPWEEGEVLVVGSSSRGPIAQVFLGSKADRIMRHSPVPVIVVPRSGQRRWTAETPSPM